MAFQKIMDTIWKTIQHLVPWIIAKKISQKIKILNENLQKQIIYGNYFIFQLFFAECFLIYELFITNLTQNCDLLH